MAAKPHASYCGKFNACLGADKQKNGEIVKKTLQKSELDYYYIHIPVKAGSPTGCGDTVSIKVNGKETFEKKVHETAIQRIDGMNDIYTFLGAKAGDEIDVQYSADGKTLTISGFNLDSREHYARIAKAFEKMGKTYSTLFKEYLPTHFINGSKSIKGFTEKNLTVQLCYAYKSLSEETADTIVWFEIPLSDGKHFDGLMIDNTSKALYFIESKRLYGHKYYAGENEKFHSMMNDWDRMSDYYNQIPNHDKFKDYKHLKVVVADLVEQNKKLTELRERIESDSFLTGMKEGIAINDKITYWLYYNCEVIDK